MYKNEVRKKNKKASKKIGRFFLSIIFIALIIFGGIKIFQSFFPQAYNSSFVSSVFGIYSSKKVKKAAELQMPDWIDSQIIAIHSTARTGIQLTDIKDVVIHYVGNPGSTAKNNRDYFNRLSTRVSSHFIVGLDGEIIQCVPLNEKSAASNNRNIDTISIEVCHPDETGKFNEKTYNSLIKLTAWLCKEFDLSEEHIIRHYDVTGKICPKYYVEHPDAWETLKSDVTDYYENSR